MSSQQLGEELSWHLLASCRGKNTSLFFPEEPDRAPLAMAICRRCPVRQACLAEALARPELLGIWGGTTEADRVRLRQRLTMRSLRPLRPSSG